MRAVFYLSVFCAAISPLLEHASAEVLVDPTQPQRMSAERAMNKVRLPTLTSILIGAQRKWAVIDGEVVAEGDRVSGFELRDIERDGVVLVRDYKDVHISLDKEETGGADI